MTRVRDCTIAVLLFVVFLSPASHALTKLYVASTGNDVANGTSPAQPVKTLNRVQAILQATDPDGPIEVHIAPGTYLGQSVSWTYFNGSSITFTPLNFGTTRPVFDGQGASVTWFRLAVSVGIETQLKFRYLQIQNYLTAISFDGNREQVDTVLGWNGVNDLDGMQIQRIGGKYTTDLADSSTAAVRFVNSRRNRVVNSHFVDVENDTALSPASLHAIYIAHRSSNNLIENNEFRNVSGDPVRVRDSSDYNRILGNTFVKAGAYGYSEWFCDIANTQCTSPVDECPSFGNEFRNNDLVDGYAGPIGTFIYYQSLGTSCPRLRTSGNAGLTLHRAPRKSDGSRDVPRPGTLREAGRSRPRS